MARKYQVEGTRDFLYWAIGLLLLGLWAVRDGWFPPPSVQKKHPLRVPAAFEVAGVVSEIHVSVDDPVRAGQLLVGLHRKDEQTRRDALERRLRELNELASWAEAMSEEERAAERLRLSQALAEAVRAVMQRELRAPTNGVVRAIHVRLNDTVKPGQTAIEVDPQTHFYIFNKVLAVLSLAGSLVCFLIHLKVR